MRKSILTILIFFCTSTLLAQKKTILSLGIVSDFPLSRNVNYDYGIGGEASLIISSKKFTNMIFSVSVINYQFTTKTYPYSADPVYKINKIAMSRVLAGKLIKINEKAFFTLQGGFTISTKGTFQSESLGPTFLIGPTYLLPIKEKLYLKFNGSLGYFEAGFFASGGMAFGVKL